MEGRVWFEGRVNEVEGGVKRSKEEKKSGLRGEEEAKEERVGFKVGVGMEVVVGGTGVDEQEEEEPFMNGERASINSFPNGSECALLLHISIVAAIFFRFFFCFFESSTQINKIKKNSRFFGGFFF